MTRVLSITSGGGTIATDDGTGVRAGLGVRGFGMPPVATQWFEGAGDGATYRGARVLPRVVDLPIRIYGANRAAVWDRMSLVARIFAPLAGDVRLTARLDGEDWYINVRRTGGGDWAWDEDTDGETFLKTVITVQAGDPYWQRVNQESKQIILGGLGRGLLKTPSPRLSALRVSTTAAFGSVAFSNSGDVDAFGLWRVGAPFTDFALISAAGELLIFEDAKATGWIDVNMELGTVTDETGANRYDGLASTPRFWSIPQGESEADVLVTAATSASTISVVWSPRKWVAF